MPRPGSWSCAQVSGQASPVASGHVDEDPDHRLRRRGRAGAGHRGGDDLARGAARRELADDDPGVHPRQREPRDQRDPDPGGDQPLHGLVVVALERDVRLEPGGQAGTDDVPGAGTRGGGLHPVLVAQVLELQRPACAPADALPAGRRASGPRAGRRYAARLRDVPARPGTRTAARGRTRRRAVAVRSPRARPRRASARRRDVARGTSPPRAASASPPRTGTTPPAAGPRESPGPRRGRPRRPRPARRSPRRGRSAWRRPRSAAPRGGRG